MTQPATAAPDEYRRPPVDWRRAAEGIQLTGFAVFLLLNTTGVLPWSFWLDAIALWPVLIMSAGVRVAFEKSGAPWLLLLGPALVLGSLAWVASGSRPDVAIGPWTQQTQARPPGATSVQLRGRLAGARLQLDTAELDPGLLVEARSAGGTENAQLEAHADGEQALLKLQGGWRKGFVFLPGRRERWQLRLPSNLPLSLDLSGAALRTTADLSSGRVADAHLDGVFMGLDLRLPAPDKPVALELGGVFNALTLTVPAGVPVRVHGAGLPFNAIDRGVPGSAGAPGYDVRVKGIFTAVSVETRARPEAPTGAAGPRPKAEVEPTPPAPGTRRTP
ncbi:MAG: hypothetical protein ACM3PV_03120 [Betaproteobacteria bacterium]